MTYSEQDLQNIAAMQMRNTKGAIYTGKAIPAEEMRIAMQILSGNYSREIDHANASDWE